MRKDKQIILATAVVTASAIVAINSFLDNEIAAPDLVVLIDYEDASCQAFFPSEFDSNIILTKEEVVLDKTELDLHSLKKQNSIANEYISNKTGIPSLVELNELSSIYSLPKNLLHSLMLKESGGNLLARSEKGARGLFQFLPRTARQFGLVVNKKTDERTNPWKAADASARYLAWIFTYFHPNVERDNLDNYKYVLAGYNAGIGKVKRTGNLVIPNYKETIDYVDLIIGHARGDLYLIKRGDRLTNIALDNEVKYSELKKMNNGIKQENLIAGRYLLVNKKSFDQHHVVNKGDSLYAISRAYSVSIDELMIVNNLKGNLIGIGQKIRIPF